MASVIKVLFLKFRNTFFLNTGENVLIFIYEIKIILSVLHCLALKSAQRC